MTGDPSHYVWWLVSRSSGIVALALISASVLLGLAMAAKLVAPRAKRSVVRLHEYLAMTALAATGLHGLALLGDTWLKPGIAGIAIPFQLSYRPAFTGLGILAGYLALLLGPSFYLRRRIGARRWRKLHRMTALVWGLSVVHTLGAGSDGKTVWLRAIVLAPALPIVYALVMRLLVGGRKPATGTATRTATATATRAATATRTGTGTESERVAPAPRPARERGIAGRIGNERATRDHPAHERPAREHRAQLEPAWGDGTAR